jgi:hypothetical protein
VVRLSSNPNFDAKFLQALGFGKQEGLWITQYDSFPIRGGFLCHHSMVGRDSVTNCFCGKHTGFLKCGESSLHGAVGGRDFYHNRVSNCHLYRCRVCWKYGWCVDRARSIGNRFLTAEQILGLPVSSVEHVSASVPKRLYGLSGQEMVKECIRMCKLSGMTGGVTILHPFRKDLKRRDLFKSFHYHVLGYIEGGYDRCRSCVKVGCCWGCDGFEGVTRRAHKEDGWIVSLAKNQNGVVEKRDSVVGTGWYQLEHSGFKVGVRNFQIVVWFGNVAKRKFKTVVKRVEFLCPICGSVCKRSWLPDGVEPIVANRGERGFLKNFTLPHIDDENVLNGGDGYE